LRGEKRRSRRLLGELFPTGRHQVQIRPREFLSTKLEYPANGERTGGFQTVIRPAFLQRVDKMFKFNGHSFGPIEGGNLKRFAVVNVDNAAHDVDYRVNLCVRRETE